MPGTLGGLFGDSNQQAIASPQQVQSLRDYAAALMQPVPFNPAGKISWTQGLADALRSGFGGYLSHQADVEQQAALTAGAQAIAPYYSGSLFQNPSASSPPPAAPTNSGTVVGNNPGNIRATLPDGTINPAVAKMPGFQGAGRNGFAVFDTVDNGVNGMKTILQGYGSQGINTLNGVAAKWAPSGDGSNDPVSYAQTVGKATGIDPNAKIDLTDPGTLAKVIPAMAQVEQGHPVNFGTATPPAASGTASVVPASTASASATQPDDMGQRLSAMLANPWIAPEMKSQVLGLMQPHIVQDGFGNSYWWRPGAAPQMIMQGGHFTSFKGPGGMEFPGYVSGTPAAPQTQLLVPNASSSPVPTNTASTTSPQANSGATAPDATSQGPFAAIAPAVTQMNRMEAQERAFENESEKTAGTLDALKQDGLDAKGKLSQLQAVSQLGDRVGYGITPLIQQKLGEYGINTKGLTDIQAYQAALNYMAPQLRPEGSGRLMQTELDAFKQSLGGLMTTPEGRRLASQNLQTLLQYQQQVGEVANDTSLSQNQRMSKIYALPAPQLSFSTETGTSSPYAATSPASPQIPAGPQSQAQVLSQAKDAIMRGAPRDAVIGRLKQMNINPSGL